MKTYQFVSPENTVVAVIDADGVSRMSMMAAGMPDGVEILPAPTEHIAEIVAHKTETLWGAADRYVSGHISGVAVGILTIGVIQQKPKCLAVSAWSSSVWAEYYKRKAAITATSDDDHDFSKFGPIPHSVPELQIEVGL